MKEKNENVSRRNFLRTGGAVAAASIIAIPALGAPDSKDTAATVKNTAGQPALLTNDPVYTESVQTLTNKTIPSRSNTVGTDYVNIREYEFQITGTDITTALKSAMASIPYGGQILIPHGNWTSRGGHDLSDGMSIEGVGYSGSGGYGTQITLLVNPLSTQPSPPAEPYYDYMFRFISPRRNCSLKNMTIALPAATSSTNKAKIGLLITNNASGQVVYQSSVENLCISGGEYGIKVDAAAGPFECSLCSIDRVAFIGNKIAAFYCNTVDSGFAFDSCYFGLLTLDATALHCETVGNISLNHCLFSGTTNTDDGTTLRTVGTYNNITFYDCQDEGIHYIYQNSTNSYRDVPVVFRNCLVQGKFNYSSAGSVVFDSTRVNITGINGHISDKAYNPAYDTDVSIYFQGLSNVINNGGGVLTNFQNELSRVYYESNEVGLPRIETGNAPSPGTTYDDFHVSRGAVNIASGQYYVSVINNLVRPSSLIFTQLRTSDPNGARINFVTAGNGYFTIYLNQNAAADLSVGFKVEF